jgi:hypothetical protein
LIGKHRLVCGDCRDRNVLTTLFSSGARASVCITSPPYATQREYDPASGFKPVPPEEYVEWFRAVAGGVESVLTPDGSYFLNIKAHADDGKRNLYVMDLVLAHRRQWGWRFVDEFCWRRTDNGVPGGWGNRFKNAWEPVFHFCRQQRIKFRPQAVGHESDDCFEYSPNNPKSRSRSGLLGTGIRGAAADAGKNQGAWERTRSISGAAARLEAISLDLAQTASRRAQNAAIIDHAINADIVLAGQVGTTEGQQTVSPAGTAASETTKGAVAAAGAGEAVSAEAVTANVANLFTSLTPVIASALAAAISQTIAALVPVVVTASGGASTPSQTQAKPTA